MVGSKEGEGRAGKLLKSRCDAGQACVSRHNDDTLLVTSSHSWTKLELRRLNSKVINLLVPSSAFHTTCASVISLIRRLRLVVLHTPYGSTRRGLAARHFVALPNDVIINKKTGDRSATFVIFVTRFATRQSFRARRWDRI